jgi:hypothetical protein
LNRQQNKQRKQPRNLFYRLQRGVALVCALHASKGRTALPLLTFSLFDVWFRQVRIDIFTI